MNNQTSEFLYSYARMDVCGVVVPCPYWMNKLKGGIVFVRGFQNGKGDASCIKNELLEAIHKEQIPYGDLSESSIQKLARRHRIGIDCSGFAYRLLDFFIFQNIISASVLRMDDVFDGGIDKTNVKRLIDPKNATSVSKLKDIRMGDVISTKKGKHILVVVDIYNDEVVYAHSSYQDTRIKGVHVGRIGILDYTQNLKNQLWDEKTAEGEPYPKTYFFPEDGDGVYRMNFFV